MQRRWLPAAIRATRPWTLEKVSLLLPIYLYLLSTSLHQHVVCARGYVLKSLRQTFPFYRMMHPLHRHVIDRNSAQLIGQWPLQQVMHSRGTSWTQNNGDTHPDKIFEI